MPTFKEAFLQLARQHGFRSIRSFAAKAGLHPNTVTSFIRGDRASFTATEEAVADALGMTPLKFNVVMKQMMEGPPENSRKIEALDVIAWFRDLAPEEKIKVFNILKDYLPKEN